MKSWLGLLIAGCLLPIMTYAGDPVARITFRVIDDNGNIVTGAVVSTSTFLRWIPGSGAGHDENDIVKGVTDTNGIVVITMKSKDGNISYGVYGAGNWSRMSVSQVDYYRDGGGKILFKKALDGKWQPWNPSVSLQIKRIINPIPMYARQMDSVTIPEAGKALGFDLIKSDWVKPYGQGETADFVFTLDCKLGGKTSNGYQIFDATLTLTFSNEDDGIQVFPVRPREGSLFRMPRYAPETGYETNWMQRSYDHEGTGFFETREDLNYFFRVRTKKDDKGNIVSALYGKIHGEIDYSIREKVNSVKFTYYLNPTPNDRNMEFDPKRNLFKDLKSTEQVTAP